MMRGRSAGGSVASTEEVVTKQVPKQRAAEPTAPDPVALLRSRKYVGLLVIAATLGVPVAAAAYFFLSLVSHLQRWVFTELPQAVGFESEPLWWPVLPLFVAGVLVGLTVRYLPGRGGEVPAEGFHAGGGPPAPKALPGIALASLTTLALGAVVGPEGPLIALGGGLAALFVHLVKPAAPTQAVVMIGAAGSFAAISTLLGSPLLGAFLLMEASGLGGATLGLVLVPGLLAAGIGALIFVGLDSLTGLGAQSLAIPSLPAFAHPDVAQFGWALSIGVGAAVLGTVIRRGALFLQPRVERRLLVATPVLGLVIAGLAIAYAQGSGKPSSDVLFSGQDALGPLIHDSATYSVGALLLLILCKAVAYGVSLSSFRGGPIFPAMFLGAAGGIALSHLPGLPVIPAVAMGIGAMAVTMLRLPMVSVLLATLLLESDGLAVMPLVIVAVVVAHVVTAHLTTPPPVEAGEGVEAAETAEAVEPAIGSPPAVSTT
jgi:H+/Cl- antiporter ClcA